jgi:hypothetical protein
MVKLHEMKVKIETTILVTGLHRVTPKIDERGSPQSNTSDHHVPQSNLASQQPQPQKTPLITGRTDFSHKCRHQRASDACVFVA